MYRLFKRPAQPVFLQLWNGSLLWLSTRRGIALLLGATLCGKDVALKPQVRWAAPALRGICELRTWWGKADSHLLLQAHSSAYVRCLGLLAAFTLVSLSLVSYLPMFQLNAHNLCKITPCLLRIGTWSFLQKESSSIGFNMWESGVFHCPSRPIE